MKTTNPSYQKWSPRRYRHEVSNRIDSQSNVRSPRLKRGGKYGNIGDFEPVPVAEAVMELQAIRRLVQQNGAKYDQVVGELSRLFQWLKLDPSRQREFGDSRYEFKRYKQRIRILAADLLGAISMLVGHQVKKRLESSGLLANIDARSRWNAILFAHNGIIGNDDQNIDREKAELAAAKIDVPSLFTQHLYKYPDLIHHADWQEWEDW